MGNDEEWVPTGFTNRATVVHLQNDLSQGLEYKVPKFTVDTKVAALVSNSDKCMKIQDFVD